MGGGAYNSAARRISTYQGRFRVILYIHTQRVTEIKILLITLYGEMT